MNGKTMDDTYQAGGKVNHATNNDPAKITVSPCKAGTVNNAINNE